MIEWRKQYVEVARDELLGVASGLDCSDEPDRTIQSYRDDADINVLVRRYGVTRDLPLGKGLPFYGDFVGVGSYQDALNAILEADAAFETLPAAVRNRFRNNPGELLTFLADESNREEAEKLGLLEVKVDSGAQLRDELGRFASAVAAEMVKVGEEPAE